MKDLINKIKKKPELSGISSSVIEKELSSYLKKHSISLPSAGKYEKIIIKEIRSVLRRYTGQYQPVKKRKKLSKTNLLESHQSTLERVDDYTLLKSTISSLNPKSILDLGCGLNPLALADKKVEYLASDINESELSIIEDFFKKNKIEGRTFVFDLNDIGKISELPESDLVLVLKVLDLVKDKRQVTKSLLENLKTKTIIVSFPTTKLSGKPMNEPRRLWFEALLKNLKLSYDVEETSNEMFYVIKLQR